MLSAKFWRLDAIVRLLLSMFICMFAGSVLSTLLDRAGRKVNATVLVLELAALGLLGYALALVLARKSWRLDTFLSRMLWIMGCFYAAIILGVWAQKLLGPPPEGTSVTQMIIATLSIQGAGLAFMTVFVHEHGLTWSEAFGLSNQWPRAMLFGILAACIFLPIARLLQEASYQIMTHVPRLPLLPEEQEVVQTLRHASAWAERIPMGLATIILAPIAEEMFFRGILYPAIKQAGFPRLALWTTSLIFAAIHFTPVIFLPLLVLALLLVWLYEKTDNLLAPITAHSLFNGLNFTMVYLLENRLG